MSSFTRRLQIRALKKAGRRKLPVLSQVTGNGIASLWPRQLDQLAYFSTPTGPVPVFAHTKHPTLQVIIDILAEDDRRRRAAT